MLKKMNMVKWCYFGVAIVINSNKMQSRFVSQFTINRKNIEQTPQTALTSSKDRPHQSPTCQFCQQHLATTASLRKNQILLQLKIQQLQEQLFKLEKENEELVNRQVLTYNQYQSKIESEDSQYWNREDIEAELFQARIIIELLLITKSAHPQIKTITDEGLKNKYSDVLLENMRLREMVEMRDRVITEREMFPIYRYDKRVQTLRKAVGFWYRKAEEDCRRMKEKVKQMRGRVEEDRNLLVEEVRKEFIRNKDKVKQEISHLSQLSKCHQNSQRRQIKNNPSSLVQKKKPATLTSRAEIKKFR